MNKYLGRYINKIISLLIEAADQKIFVSWNADLENLKTLAELTSPTTKSLKAWHFYGDAKYVMKNVAGLIGKSVKQVVHPLADIVGIAVGAAGLHNAIANGNTQGIITNTLSIVGGIVGLGLFTATQITGMRVCFRYLKGLCHGLLASIWKAKIYICVVGNLKIMAHLCHQLLLC